MHSFRFFAFCGPWEFNLADSGVVSLSLSDANKLKNLLLEQLKSNLKVITESKEEVLYNLNIDFFNLFNRK